MRITNFLLWQIAYAELYVTETLWPDFTRTDLLHAVLEYQKRDRRYGGLSARRAGGTGTRKRRSSKHSVFVADEADSYCAGPDSARGLGRPLGRSVDFSGVLATVACLCWYEYNEIAGGYGFGKPRHHRIWRGLALLAWKDVHWAGGGGVRA